jgi:hypothetical protein
MSTVLEPSIFGPIVAGSDVEEWTLALLKRWISTYLAEVERQHGMSGHDLPRPKGYAIGMSFDKWPEDQVPGILVVSRATAGTPRRGGDGGYWARWSIDAGAVCSAATQADSHRLAELYAAAIRTLILQRPSLDGQVQGGIEWLGENYDDLGYDETRSLYAAKTMFTVQVNQVTFANAGPTTPDAPLAPDDTVPWADWPTVETVEHEIQIMVPPAGGTREEEA